MSNCCAGADSVVYLSLEGLVNAVNEGRHDMCTKSLHHTNTTHAAGIVDADAGVLDADAMVLNGKTEECSVNVVCNSGTMQQCDRDNCSISCSNGYCVACLNGSYPVDLDW